ncbi:hypothetical protein MTQ13_00100 [Streptomyces sp. XM4011]|uniref:hypothetical protein n=1 Tax=Streptomyces sp. XM4011 TaxID=2929780 RepID=UPI001FF8B962|nr:hypothetical protein [Streptomyces sp. XM4011]MCK1812693.1 hypothetical protein [Streptomyces sp. XM4011]
MRKAVRLAAPAALAAAALVLTGCSSDSDSDSGNDAKGSGSQEETTTGGDDATDDEAAGDDAPAGGPNAEDLTGWWSSDLTSTEANTIVVSEGEVTALLNLSAVDADICSGTVTDGALALDCALGADFEAATLTLDGSTLDVAWSNGTTETYHQVPGMEDFDMGDLGDLGDLGEIDMEFDF